MNLKNENINKCADGSYDCDNNVTCSDTVGPWSYSCDTDNSGTGQEYNDVNEYAAAFQGDNCVVNAVCSHNNGSFSCKCAAVHIGVSAVVS